MIYLDTVVLKSQILETKIRKDEISEREIIMCNDAFKKVV